MPRITRIAGSFACIAIAYWLYAVIVVPRIELPADPQQKTSVAGKTRVDPIEEQLKRLKPLFPPSAWDRLKNSNIINLDNGRNKLIFENLTPGPNNQVRLAPCAIIVGQEGGIDPWDLRQSIILEAPEAVLKLDKPFNMNELNSHSTRVEMGWLNGQIVIRSEGRNLRIVTSDAVLTEQVIWTPNDVRFQFGAHHGQGRQMRIKLLSDSSNSTGGSAVPNVVGIESIELRQIDKQQGVCFNLATPNATGKPTANIPVEIRCDGPFVFNAIDQVATFSDQVEVLKLNPNAPRDQVLCDRLAVFFMSPSKKDATPAAAKQPPDLANLVAELVEARGNPVTITAPSESLKANAQILRYNLLTKVMEMRMLDGDQNVMLRKDANEIRARSLVYQADAHDPNRRIGRITAGPGLLRSLSAQSFGHSATAAPSSSASPQFEAVWNGQLTVCPSKGHGLVYPHPQEHVVELNGGARLTYRSVDGNGQWNEQQLNAQKVNLWLLEGPSPTDPARSQLQPKSMQAVKDVALVSSQVSGQTDELQVWFEEEEPGGAGKPSSAATPAVRSPIAPVAPPQPRPSEPQSPQSLAAQTPAAAGTGQHFNVLGKLVQARVAIQNSRPAVAGLTIIGNVQLRETQTRQIEERPFLICGEKLRVVDADKPSAEINVFGSPAEPNQPARLASFEGRGLGLTGSNINLNCGTNRLWIDGAGRMSLPLAKDLQGNALATPGVITIDWKYKMDFDGFVAKFEKEVAANVQQPLMRADLRTEAMKVTLEQPVRLAGPQTDQQPQVKQIQCPSGVRVDGCTLDPSQQRQSIEQLETSDLLVNLITGEMSGGAGWFNRVWLAADDPAGNPLVASVGAQPSPSAAASSLKCLHVRFAESMTGNVLWHKLAIKDHVQATYAPVKSWDAVLNTDDPTTLEPGGIVIQADLIEAAEGPTPLGNGRSAQVDAEGNVSVDGATFRTQSHRMSYDQAKDLLVLEGDGFNDAKLFRQAQPNAPPETTSARKFQYDIKRNRPTVDGVKSFEFRQMGPPNRQPAVPSGSMPGNNRRP